VEGGPGFGNVRTPFAFEAFQFGIGRGVAGEIFLDQAGHGAEGGAVVGKMKFQPMREHALVRHMTEDFTDLAAVQAVGSGFFLREVPQTIHGDTAQARCGVIGGV